MKVEVTDDFLRDGLQDEPVVVSTAHKLEIAAALVDAGLKRMEVASFVNPKRVPQMADAADVVPSLPAVPGVTYTSLALNGSGIQRAVDSGATDIQVVTSASQAHSKANAGQAIEDALASLGAAVAEYPEARFFAGISTAFTCPFEGAIDPAYLLRVVRVFKDMGITDVGLADTLGTTPTGQVMASLHHVREAEPDLTYYLHLHNAHSQALATASATTPSRPATGLCSRLMPGQSVSTTSPTTGKTPAPNTSGPTSSRSLRACWNGCRWQRRPLGVTLPRRLPEQTSARPAR
jgi:hydroxymethylglutaryl-CoA lyase